MKRAIALFLAMVFVFALLPVSALAADGTVTITGADLASGTGTLNKGVTDVLLTAKAVNGKVVSSITCADSAVTLHDFDANAGTIKCDVSSTLADDSSTTVSIVVKYADPTLTVATNCKSYQINDKAEITPTGTAVSFLVDDKVKVTAEPTDAAGGVLEGFSVSPSTNITVIEEGSGFIVFKTTSAVNVNVRAKYKYPVTLDINGLKETKYFTLNGSTYEYTFTVAEPASVIINSFAVTSGTAQMDPATWTASSTTLKITTATPNAVVVTANATQLYEVTPDDAAITLPAAGATRKAGFIKAGETVEVAANGYVANEVKVKSWSNGATVDATGEKGTFTMPASAVTVKPTYEYGVVLGTANKGYFSQGTTVSVSSSAPLGQRLKSWTVANAADLDAALVAQIEGSKADPLTFTMPAKQVKLTATYSDMNLAVTMQSQIGTATAGTAVAGVNYIFNGGGQASGLQATGDILTLSAPETYKDSAGQVWKFKTWSTTDTTGTLSNETSYNNATFTVGTAAPTIVAKYEKAYALYYTNAGGSVTEYYYVGETVSKTAPDVSGQSFVNWTCYRSDNSAVLVSEANNATAKSVTFAMKDFNITLRTNYTADHTVSVSGVDAKFITITHKDANGNVTTTSPKSTTFTAPVGDTIAIQCQDKTSDATNAGVRVFTNWSISPSGVVSSTTDLSVRTLTFTMGASDVTVQANYKADESDWIYTGAYIDVLYNGKPLSDTNPRYYAFNEYIASSDFEIIFHKNAQDINGQKVLLSDCNVTVYQHGTTNLAMDSSGCLNQIGTFDLSATYYVGGKQMSAPARISNGIIVLNYRPEFTVITEAPKKTTIYEGEDVNTEGLVTWLKSADHQTGEYFSVRKLADTDKYTVYPQWNSTKKAYVNEDGSVVAYKTDSKGQYIELYVIYADPNQANKVMTPIPDPRKGESRNDGLNKIYVKTAAKDLYLEGSSSIAYTGTSAVDYDQYDFVNQATLTWVMKLGVSGVRSLNITATRPVGATDNLETYIDSIVNSDPSVATITLNASATTADKVVYTVTPVGSGETTVTVKLKGSGETKSYKLQVLTNVNENTEPIASFELNPENLTLYVGSKFAIIPTNIMPSNANPTMNKWEAVYADTLATAEYCVTVSDSGTVSVINYPGLDANGNARKILIRATPKYAVTTLVIPTCTLTIKQVDVTNMTLSPATMTLYNKATKQLTATLYPDGATDKSINWTTSDSNIVTVDAQGKVTGMKVGTAIIKAASVSNSGIYKTCTITVVDSVLATELYLNRSSYNMGIDESVTLTAYLAPATATTQVVEWSSDNPAIATVDANGKIRSLREGIVTITAKATDGSGLSASCLVTVSTVVSTAITLSKTAVSLIEGESEQITATVYPSNVTTSGVKWSSSNESVAIVYSDGTIEGVGGGGAIITATAKDGSSKYADCIVVVTAKIPAASITLNLSSFDLLYNDTTTLKATLSPANATGKVTWISSDPTVASVDTEGRVSGLKVGTAKITATHSGISVSINVSVVTGFYNTGTVVNCARRVNVRSKASGSSGMVGYAYLGDIYKVLEKSGNWYKIQYNSTTTAYIWANYLNTKATSAGYTSSGAVGTTTPAPGTTAVPGTVTPTPTPVASKTLRIVNCANCVNVRSGAGTTFSRLGYAYLGEVFAYTQLTNGFYEITYNGATAYISANFCSVS